MAVRTYVRKVSGATSGERSTVSVSPDGRTDAQNISLRKLEVCPYRWMTSGGRLTFQLRAGRRTRQGYMRASSPACITRIQLLVVQREETVKVDKMITFTPLTLGEHLTSYTDEQTTRSAEHLKVVQPHANNCQSQLGSDSDPVFLPGVLFSAVRFGREELRSFNASLPRKIRQTLGCF